MFPTFFVFAFLVLFFAAPFAFAAAAAAVTVVSSSFFLLLLLFFGMIGFVVIGSPCQSGIALPVQFLSIGLHLFPIDPLQIEPVAVVLFVLLPRRSIGIGQFLGNRPVFGHARHQSHDGLHLGTHFLVGLLLTTGGGSGRRGHVGGRMAGFGPTETGGNPGGTGVSARDDDFGIIDERFLSGSVVVVDVVVMIVAALLFSFLTTAVVAHTSCGCVVVV